MGGLFTLKTPATDKLPFQDVARDGHLLYMFLDHKEPTRAWESHSPPLIDQVSDQGMAQRETSSAMHMGECLSGT